MTTLASAATTDTQNLTIARDTDHVAHSTPPSQTSLKVLISAYSCQPGLGSEPGVGWNTISQVSRLHEVWVLTAAEQREAIEAELAQNPMPNVHWNYVDVPDWLTRSWKKGERGRRIHYGLWQYWAYLKGKQLHQQIGFDIVHHITFVSYWTPSYLALLDVPFVWGPIGGGDSTPRVFYSTLSWKSRRNEFLRDSVRMIAHHLDPFVRLTASHAAIALPTTERTADKVRSLGARDVRVTSEVALAHEDIELLNAPRVRQGDEPFRVVSLGRLLGWKGYHLGIQAFAQLQKSVPASEYWIVGTGPENDRLKMLAETLGVVDKVRFMGNVPREEAFRLLTQADVFLHPSLHDTGSWVCLEAMAAGLPVVCLHLAGPATLITDETGFRVPVSSLKQSINDLGLALLQLAQEPELRQRMSTAGRERIRANFDWNSKGEQFDRIYRELVKAKA